MVTNTEFQYPKVRLKVGVAGTVLSLTEISIPEGAIKSLDAQGIIARATRISIPEGAIKRERRYENIRNVLAFQYPKVRLKAVASTTTVSTRAISIPEGAIKSRPNASASPFDLSFQYPKVRLKVLWAGILSPLFLNFNTRRCD